MRRGNLRLGLLINESRLFALMLCASSITLLTSDLRVVNGRNCAALRFLAAFARPRRKAYAAMFESSQYRELIYHI